jgi:ribosomal protein L11 methyltransferase
MKQYPAIDVRTVSPDLLVALVDDFNPTAVEERADSVRVFFTSAHDRDEAQRALAPQFDVAAIEVDDEDWARRSQENLKPITVGRITVAPPWAAISSQPSALSPDRSALSPEPAALRVVILPSMGFGTGHHVTTRLCLAALQTLDLNGRTVLDVGTGSGVLAIAADLLGASQVTGIDFDADAIQSARENLELNPAATHVTVETVDLAARPLPPVDIVTANLTGGLLVRSATTLLGAVRPDGVLILSGIQSHERDEVRTAFAAAADLWERDEDGWIGMAVKKR